MTTKNATEKKPRAKKAAVEAPVPTPVAEAPKPVRQRTINPEIAATREAVKRAREEARETAARIKEANQQAKLDKSYDVLCRKEASLLGKIEDLQAKLSVVRQQMAKLD